MEGIHISLASETIGSLGGLSITNTLIMTWVASALLVFAVAMLGRRVSLATPSRMQTLVELGVSEGISFTKAVLENDKAARSLFPLLAGLFIFITTLNWLEFIPGVGSIGFYITEAGHTEFAPLFRSANTDLNTTLALTLIVFIVIEVFGVRARGLFGYLKKFFDFSSPLKFLVGIIELVSELGRLVSYSFRLYGNIFAGEVLIAVVSFFVPYLLPSAFMAFELFVGFIQGAIFALLTLFFVKLAIVDPHESH